MKWQWAGHISRRTDDVGEDAFLCGDRGSAILCFFLFFLNSLAMLVARCLYSKFKCRVGHPLANWSNDLRTVAIAG